MKIYISQWINTRSYYLNKISSISFIEDVRNNVHYILKDSVSELWNVIVSTCSYQKVFNFAVKNKMENQLADFLAELRKENIIAIDGDFPLNTINNKKYLIYKVYKDSSNYNHFTDRHTNFMVHNNLLELLYLELNYKCNLICKHCFNPKNFNDSEITFEQAKTIIDEAYDLGLNSVILTGGECTINKDFLEIASYVREKHLELGILTNAQKLYDDEVLFDEIVKLYPSLIKISLYSMKAEIHDYITGVKGSHSKTLSVIKKLKDKNILVKLTCPQLSYNFGSYKEVKQYAKSIDVRYSYSCHFINNKNNNNEDAKLSLDNIEKFYRDTVKKTDAIGNFKNDRNYICGAGVNILSITPGLNVVPCVGVNYIFGNYNKNTLKELMNTSINDFRNKYRRNNLIECHKYDYCKFCFYCLLHTCFDKGFMKKSEALCDDAKAHYNAFINSLEKH